MEAHKNFPDESNKKESSDIIFVDISDTKFTGTKTCENVRGGEQAKIFTYKKSILDNTISKNFCGQKRSNLPLIVREVAPYKKSKVTCDSFTKVQRMLQAEAEVCHKRPINRSSEGGDSEPKIDGSSMLNNLHSEKCKRQGQIKCDFVCNLYKSKYWTKENNSKFIGKCKQEQGKKRYQELVKNTVDSDERNKLYNKEDDCSDDENHLMCVFCEKLFGWKTITCLKLDAPLPSSFMDPLSLVQHFGIQLSIPFRGSDKPNVTFVNVCHICYDVMLEGDVLYHKFQSVVRKMKQLWANHSTGGSSSIMISDLVGEYSLGCPSVENKKIYKVVSDGEKQRSLSTVSYVSKEKKIVFESKPNSKKDVDVSLWPNAHSPTELEAATNKDDEDWKRKGDGDKVKPLKAGKVSLTCGLCGKEFHVEDLWENHLESDHKLQKEWLKFSRFMHARLRGHIIDELIKYDVCQNGHRSCKHNQDKVDSCNYDETYVCKSCGKRFVSRNLYVEHLCLFHNITVDDSLLTDSKDSSEDKRCYQSSKAKSFSNISEVISGAEQGLSEYCTEKHSNVDDNEQEISGSEHKSFSGFEPNPGTSRESLLENIGDTSSSHRVFNKNPEFENSVGEETNTSNHTETNTTGIKCSLCHKNFQCKEELVSHVKVSHISYSEEERYEIQEDSNPVPEKALYECQVCDKTFEKKSSYLGHMYRFHDTYRYCRYCLFRCIKRKNLRNHYISKHSNSKATSVKCELCGKLIASTYIGEHKDVVHGNERNQVCEICGMKFYGRKTLRSHLYYEHEATEWKCCYCNLIFKKYYQMRQHKINVHSTKEIMCDKCPKVFKRRGDLTVHIRRAHEKSVLFCEYCSKQYKERRNLKDHLVNVHGLSREETYSKNYARHKRANNVHVKPRENLNECGKTLENPESDEAQDRSMRIEKNYSLELQMSEDLDEFEDVTMLTLA